ncbi:unnamed protein product [Urochloa decumbens]|uniref:Cytochrome P450 n=1 Tax=Urochloa decumbens TaxID=240449 RepID=A0ABC8XC24_9POAL
MRDLARRHGPVMLLRMGELPTVVVSSREAAREVMKVHDAAFSSRPLSPTVGAISNGGRDIIFAPYGEHWRQLRKVAITELLSARRVLSFRRVREEEVAAAAAASTSSAAVEMRARLSALVSDASARVLLGDRCKDRDMRLSTSVRCWPGGDPEEFRPERFEETGGAGEVDFKGTDFELLPFGAGRRMCPGMMFVVANVELVLASLLFHFDWEVPGVAKLDMTETLGVTVRRKAGLLLRPIVRVPVPGV